MPSAHENAEPKCPLAAVDRRLDEVHQHWHAAEQAYFHPESFRVAIQTAIQNLRTVTFILQNNKRAIQDFDGWYSGWQQRMGADPLMCWMRDARNKIEKQGDLEMHSFVRAEIVASYLDEGPGVELPARLFDDPGVLLRSIPPGDLRVHIAKHGVLRIQRRWVENTLPDHELLDAVAIAYGRISQVVRDAHCQIGLAAPVTTNIGTGQRYGDGAREGRLPCMIGHADARSFQIRLSDGRPVEFETINVNVTRKDIPEIKKRYGDTLKGMFGPKNGREEEIAASLFEAARNVFLIDGYHSQIFFLFRQRQLVQMRELRPDDQADKFVLMRKLAREVVINGVDAVFAISEAWRAPADSLKPYQRPAESPDRMEELLGTLVTREGTPLQFSATIRRNNGGVSLDKTMVARGESAFLFAPIYEAWGKQIPDQWMEAAKNVANVQDQPSSPTD